MRALVTGAGGFVGANLVRRLAGDGHAVTAAVRPGVPPWRLEGAGGRVDVTEVDLLDPAAVAGALDAAGPQWVFHLAAYGAYSWQTDAELMRDTNLAATAGLLASALDRGCQAFVHAGSSSEYGLKDHAPSEDEPLEPNSAYAETKAAATLHCAEVARERDAHVVTLRLYSAYGPWEEPRRMVPTLIVGGLRGELPPLVDPETARDFVFVEDVCDAFVLAAGSRPPLPGAIYNVGSGRQVTIRELVELARGLMEIEAEPEWGSMPSRAWDTAVWVADPARIRQELGWQPRHTLVGGLGAMIEWVRRSSPAILERYRAGRGDRP